MSAESFLDHAASTYADARARIDRIAAHVAASAQDIIDAHANRDWIALGYDSWNELCEAEFRGAVIGLPRAERREAVRQMSEAGMSTRAIGGALGVGVATVSRDREETTVPNGTVDDQPREVIGLDGKTRTYPPRPTITVDSETGEIIDSPTTFPGPSLEDRARREAEHAERKRREDKERAIAARNANVNAAFATISELYHADILAEVVDNWEALVHDWTADEIKDLGRLLQGIAHNWSNA